jgi:hypothetical protein
MANLANIVNNIVSDSGVDSDLLQRTITLTTTGTSGAATLSGATLNIPQYQTVLTNPVTGTGTTNYVTKWTSSSAVGSSLIFDNGTNVGIGTDSPATKLHISGSGAQTLRIENTNTSIVLNDIIGSIVFQSNDASVGGTGVAGSINSISEAASGVNYGLGFNTKTFATEIERMRITSTGEVGIGTTTPLTANVLQVTRSSNNAVISSVENTNTGTAAFSELQVRNTSVNDTGAIRLLAMGTGYTTAGGFVQNSGVLATDINIAGGLSIMTRANADMRFYTNGHTNERMRITSAGNVGIGTTSPSSKLQIQGTGTGAWLTINRTDSGTNIVDFTQSGTRLGYLGYIGNDLVINNATTSNIQFNTAGSERMRINSAGNLGIGVTPSAWWSAFKAIQIGTTGALSSGSGVTNLGHNYYFDGTNTIYLTSSGASYYQQTTGQHIWLTAPSGTAGANATFTERMRITSSGNVGIGVTNPQSILTISQGGNENVEFFTGNTTLNGGGIEYINRTTTTTRPDLNIYLGSSSTGSIKFYTTAAERMRIAANGNVGIGTSSPGEQLTLSRSSYPTVKLIDTTDNAQGYFQYHTANDYFILNAQSNHPLLFGTNDTERMRITSGGSVGIGTSSPSTWPYSALQIKNGAIASETYGTTSFTWVGTNWSNDGVTEKFIVNGRAALLTLVNGGLLFNFTPSEGTAGNSITFTQAFRIVNNGNIIIGTGGDAGYKLYVNGTSAGTSAFQNVSDGRFKKDITPVENALTKINQLNGISFNWDKEKRPELNLDDSNHLGLIAQDVEKILPQVVTTGNDELKTKTIAYSDIVPVLIEAIKELSAEIEILKNK